MNPFFVTDFSISDSLKTVRKSVLIYETIIDNAITVVEGNYNSSVHWNRVITKRELKRSEFYVDTRY